MEGKWLKWSTLFTNSNMKCVQSIFFLCNLLQKNLSPQLQLHIFWGINILSHSSLQSSSSLFRLNWEYLLTYFVKCYHIFPIGFSSGLWRDQCEARMYFERYYSIAGLTECLDCYPPEGKPHSQSQAFNSLYLGRALCLAPSQCNKSNPIASYWHHYVSLWGCFLWDNVIMFSHKV